MKLKTAKELPAEWERGYMSHVFNHIDTAVNRLINGTQPAVTKTASFSPTSDETWIICNGSGTITVTLPSPVRYDGPPINIKTIAAFTVVSASANVVPLAGGAASTAILAATAGKWVILVPDGANWIIMQGN